MTTTPPRLTRARTPPSPGAVFRSPRRSSRVIANPYSTGAMEEAKHGESSVRSRTATMLASPPSSPTSPAQPRTRPDNSKRRPANNRSAPSTDAYIYPSDSDDDEEFIRGESLLPTTFANGMLPTPSKTPRKARASASRSGATARILNYAPADPNELMPSRREIKKGKHRRASAMKGFEIFDETADSQPRNEIKVEVYTDSNARLPELDESEDNPFWVPQRPTAPAEPQRRTSRRNRLTAEQREESERIQAAADAGEGIVYTFRGRKVLRRFGDAEPESLEQRALHRQAGFSAQRPLTRSEIAPRRLFQQPNPDHVDEEALTDIEMHDAADATHDAAPATAADSTTPATSRSTYFTTPPTTTRTNRKVTFDLAAAMPPIVEEAVEQIAAEHPATDEQLPAVDPSSPVRSRRRGKQSISPFGTWQRTKSGRKREGDAMEESSATGSKRARGASAVANNHTSGS